MAIFEVRDGQETLFATDCPHILRSFLASPENYRPGMAEPTRAALQRLRGCIHDDAADVTAGCVRLMRNLDG